MIDFLYQYGMFLAQVVTLVVAILVVIGGIVSATLLTLVLLPALYKLVHGREKDPSGRPDGEKA